MTTSIQSAILALESINQRLSKIDVICDLLKGMESGDINFDGDINGGITLNTNQTQSPKVNINLIGPALKKRRRATGLTMDKAAEQLHIADRTIRNHEKRGVRDIVTLDRICRFYGIQLVDLIREVQS
ncbi:MAG: helix-turn-helix transcriptional regulator [Candidatus Thiodiazotropha endolucinida]